ncbi:MAG: C40 family peptidase [Bacteroidales bacterium]|nr:C40 family peptidase [Bacteroidales bacterium]
MKKKLSILCILMVGVWFFTSCDTVKRFLSTDLEEEDYSLGELYVDEYVKEVPYVPTPSEEAKAEGRVNSLGIEREEGDNEALYDAIQSWIGTPYRYGGTTKAGIDCSGFVGNIYQEVFNKKLQRVANDMQQDCTLISRSELKEGDLVFFTNSKGRVSHVGIYLKNDIFAHSSTSRGVIISRLGDSYWSKHFYKGGRVN